MWLVFLQKGKAWFKRRGEELDSVRRKGGEKTPWEVW